MLTITDGIILYRISPDKDKKKINLTKIQPTANKIPISTGFFILAIHRNQELLVGNCIFHMVL